jgi:hypothetical protein
MKNVLNKNQYLIDENLQNALQNCNTPKKSNKVYQKGIYLVKAR